MEGAEGQADVFLDVSHDYSREVGLAKLEENLAWINNKVTERGRYRLNTGMPQWAAIIAIRSALEQMELRLADSASWNHHLVEELQDLRDKNAFLREKEQASQLSGASENQVV